MVNEASPAAHPRVDVTLSRPAYRLGGTVVGMIRIESSLKGSDDTHITTRASALSEPLPSPREEIESLEIAMVAQCRLDERWHSAKSQLKDSSLSDPTDLWKEFPQAKNTHCVWSSNRIDLLQLQERSTDRWEDVRPKPIRLPGRTNERVDNSSQENGSNGFPSATPVIGLENFQLVYTFRVDLPVASSLVAPTLVATSCRYHYAIVIRLVSRASPKPTWIQVPVQIEMADPTSATTKVNVETSSSSLSAMAHSNGLPTVLTAAELNQWEGRLSAHRQSIAHSRHIRRDSPSSVQSMRVTDPGTGKPACLLTMMGAAILHPGSRMILKLDFPTSRRKDDDNDELLWVPVHQVSACLQGEEIAIRLGDGQRTRARSFLFDTAHQRIDPLSVVSTSLSLLLPLSAPCTVATERVEISVQCIVDIVVGDKKNKSGEWNYRNLRMEIPCQVVHAAWAWEEKEESHQSVGKAILDELDARQQRQYTDPTDPRSFVTRDTTEELRILSLCLADKCDLLPKTPYEMEMSATNGGAMQS